MPCLESQKRADVSEHSMTVKACGEKNHSKMRDWFLGSAFILFHIYTHFIRETFIFLLGKKMFARPNEKERGRKRSSTHWFLPQVAPIARSGSGWNCEPGMPAWPLTLVAATQALGSWSFQMHKRELGRWEAEQPGLGPEPSYLVPESQASA